MQETFFDFLQATDRLEEYLGDTKEKESNINNYLVCPKCGEKLIKDIEKSNEIRKAYHCNKCNKDYYKND